MAITYEGDTPQAGFYRAALVKGGPLVAIRIWFGAPVVDGEEQDRAPRWCVEADGHTDELVEGTRQLLDVYRFWPWCGRSPLTKARYDHMLAYARWCRAHAPDRPEANPTQAVKWNDTKPRF